MGNHGYGYPHLPYPKPQIYTDAELCMWYPEVLDSFQPGQYNRAVLFFDAKLEPVLSALILDPKRLAVSTATMCRLVKCWTTTS